MTTGSTATAARPRRGRARRLLRGVLLLLGAGIVFAGGFGAGFVYATVPGVTNNPPPAAMASAVAPPADTPAGGTAPAAGPAGGIGEGIAAEGVTLTVLEVDRATEIDFLEEGVIPAAAALETREAPTGGVLVSVTTELENTGTAAWDLTCGFAVQMELVDGLDRHFVPIDGLDRVPGNPECNSRLNPGLGTTMTWVFEVPDNAEGLLLGFADPELSYDELTFVELD
ncbi:hypothetical protein [Corynebacterium sphenisci]|uniref:hypothetical protein n=1 Tax=Corynebacterium sphenisci TaxID=191493 RepID=UPI0026E0BC12|nr:hypothetical protein [Corynebacterium sphenisci]MDO5730662.1 hypothetical protein [Corynebacterium sphenisci]